MDKEEENTYPRAAGPVSMGSLPADSGNCRLTIFGTKHCIHSDYVQTVFLSSFLNHTYHQLCTQHLHCIGYYKLSGKNLKPEKDSIDSVQILCHLTCGA